MFYFTNHFFSLSWIGLIFGNYRYRFKSSIFFLNYLLRYINILFLFEICLMLLINWNWTSNGNSWIGVFQCLIIDRTSILVSLCHIHFQYILYFHHHYLLISKSNVILQEILCNYGLQASHFGFPFSREFLRVVLKMLRLQDDVVEDTRVPRYLCGSSF